MKKSLFLFLFNCAFFCPAQSILKLEKDTVDIGLVIIETDSLGRFINSTYSNATFNFQNTGNEPLILSYCKGNGRGSADLPKAPVLPKGKGSFRATIQQYRYLRTTDKDGLHAFCTTLTIIGNFKGEEKDIYVTGYTKLLAKKKK
jgi:hypothetical protein